MLERLEVHDYQSLKDVDLALGQFTVIVGPSGNGKSALIRALRALAFNQVGQRFIRHGRPKAWVRLTFDDGQVVEWEKPREKGATYALNDQLYTRVGRAVPEDVENALRIRRIEIDKGFTFAPQFQSQHDLPLLLTESSTLAARALAKLTKLSVIVEAQMDCRRDGKRAGREQVAAEEEVERTKQKLRDLPNVPHARNLMERANKLGRVLHKRLETAQAADSIAQDIQGSLLLADVTLPTIQEVETLDDRMRRLEQVVAASVRADDLAMKAQESASETEDAEVVLAVVLDSYQALVDELGACPLCGSTETWSTLRTITGENLDADSFRIDA